MDEGLYMEIARKKRILEYMEQNGVVFVRLAFCDIFGQLKNISISVKSLERALDHGIGFNAAAIRGFLNVEDSDLLLFPDPDTMTVLPWRPSEEKVARFFCDIRYTDGRPFEGDVRYLLKTYEKKLHESGTDLRIKTDCEFYLFKLDSEGNPTDIPMDKASYFEVAPIDKGEDIRRDICLTMDRMGIDHLASHHEKGPGQNEVRFNAAGLLEAADNLITFKDIVKVCANRMGLFASFLPKPLFTENGSGIAISISKEEPQATRSKTAMEMAGGILRRIEETTIFLNPIANSYERFETPQTVSYGFGNQQILVKVHPEDCRVKVSSADPSCNPYLAFLLLAGAAVEGIAGQLSPNDFSTGKALPDTMIDAVRIAQESEFTRTLIPEVLFDGFLKAKKADWEESSLSGDPMLKAKNMEFPVT